MTPTSAATAETMQRSAALQALLDALTAERFGRLPTPSADDQQQDTP